MGFKEEDKTGKIQPRDNRDELDFHSDQPFTPSQDVQFTPKLEKGGKTIAINVALIGNDGLPVENQQNLYCEKCRSYGHVQESCGFTTSFATLFHLRARFYWGHVCVHSLCSNTALFFKTTTLFDGLGDLLGKPIATLKKRGQM
ncbi:hypothetical protein PIB30_060089 [Stylosanthes scabra]|uniref:Uncharacterized protein n=1 Tax=Stylosanthes scabra TaxID=79078 RepID=A0ABU6YLP7_9FABA|nr:hypothetical protein [Stylosanthes scabra]